MNLESKTCDKCISPYESIQSERIYNDRLKEGGFVYKTKSEIVTCVECGNDVKKSWRIYKLKRLKTSESKKIEINGFRFIIEKPKQSYYQIRYDIKKGSPFLNIPNISGVNKLILSMMTMDMQSMVRYTKSTWLK